jgi:hypothetical protein
VSIDRQLEALRDAIQQDPGQRGLARDPEENLFTVCRGDLAGACNDLGETDRPILGVVTGFCIPTAQPPCGETDGPLGAVFLARALAPCGVPVVLASDPFCRGALCAGLEACGLASSVPVVDVPAEWEDAGCNRASWWERTLPRTVPRPTHVLALERAGPSHTVASIRSQPETTPQVVERFHAEVPPKHRNRCHTMRGRDITELMRPAHRLFYPAGPSDGPEGPVTLGIGDGGNEIGMGKLPWEVIRRNIPGGGIIACRVPADYLIVAGVSNWGAYALAAGVALVRGKPLHADLFDPDSEREVLQVMVERGPLVDGVTAQPTATVDGLTWQEYTKPLRKIAKVAGRKR